MGELEPRADMTRDELERERQDLKLRFGDAYDRLQAILFEEDPVGINFGHNYDEYDPEVRTILPRLRTCRSVRDIQVAIHEEFCRWFNPETAGPLTRYEHVAERAFTELRPLISSAV